MDNEEKKVKEAIADYNNAVNVIKKTNQLIEHKLIEYESMFEALCPFKVGDKVRIVNYSGPRDKSSGWYIYRKCLVNGATATVKERKWDDGEYSHRPQFVFYIELDHMTYTSSLTGEEVVIENGKGVFGFGQNKLERHVDEPETLLY